MGGYSLFLGSALLGYAGSGSGIGYLAHKGYRKHQEDKADKVRREVLRKLEPEGGGRGRGGTSSEAGATLAAAGLVLLFFGALAR